MPGPLAYKIGKLLQGLGLLVVLAGLSVSIGMGLAERGLASMGAEFQGLAVGGGLFLVGRWIEKRAGAGG